LAYLFQVFLKILTRVLSFLEFLKVVKFYLEDLIN